MIHQLKTENPHFQRVWENLKSFEIRRNDRNFQVGDKLHLIEYIPGKPADTVRCIKVTVKHILTHEDFPEGLKEGYVCMSIHIDDAMLYYPQIFH